MKTFCNVPNSVLSVPRKGYRPSVETSSRLATAVCHTLGINDTLDRAYCGSELAGLLADYSGDSSSYRYWLGQNTGLTSNELAIFQRLSDWWMCASVDGRELESCKTFVVADLNSGRCLVVIDGPARTFQERRAPFDKIGWELMAFDWVSVGLDPKNV
jgi:hypothetical protein